MPRITAVITNDPAFAAAVEEDNVTHLTQHVKECRQEDYLGFECLERGLGLDLVTLEEIGTTEEEMTRFREGASVPHLERAKRFLEEARAGDFSKMYPLTVLVGERIVTYSDLGIDVDEYDELAKRYNVGIGKEILEKCRNGDFSELEGLMDGFRDRAFTLEQLGTNREELDGFRHEAYVAPAAQYLEEAEAGDFEHFDEVRELINTGKVSADDLDITQERLEEIFKPRHVGVATEILAECRNGDFERFELLMNGLENGLYTNEDLGVTGDELDGFRHQRVLAALRLAADECRRGDFSRLSTLTTVVNAGQDIGILSEEELASLDLDLEGWKRQDEVNMGRELVETLRQRGGLSEAGSIDRELLARFTAEELGLSEEDYLLLTAPETLH